MSSQGREWTGYVRTHKKTFIIQSFAMAIVTLIPATRAPVGLFFPPVHPGGLLVLLPIRSFIIGAR